MAAFCGHGAAGGDRGGSSDDDDAAVPVSTPPEADLAALLSQASCQAAAAGEGAGDEEAGEGELFAWGDPRAPYCLTCRPRGALGAVMREARLFSLEPGTEPEPEPEPEAGIEGEPGAQSGGTGQQAREAQGAPSLQRWVRRWGEGGRAGGGEAMRLPCCTPRCTPCRDMMLSSHAASLSPDIPARCALLPLTQPQGASSTCSRGTL